MSKKVRLLDYSEDPKDRLWTFKRAVLKKPVESPKTVNFDVSCEFVGGLCFAGALCRKCTLGGFSCFLFADPAVYASCPSRREKLRQLEKEQT